MTGTRFTSSSALLRCGTGYCQAAVVLKLLWSIELRTFTGLAPLVPRYRPLGTRIVANNLDLATIERWIEAMGDDQRDDNARPLIM